MKNSRLVFVLPNGRYKPETEEIRDCLNIYHVLVAFPCKQTPAENTRTESSFQEVRKIVKYIPVEDKRLPKLLCSSWCGGGVWVGILRNGTWSRIQYPRLSEFSSSSQVVLKCPPTRTDKCCFTFVPTTMWTHLKQNQDPLSQYITQQMPYVRRHLWSTSTATCFDTEVPFSGSYNNGVWASMPIWSARLC